MSMQHAKSDVIKADPIVEGLLTDFLKELRPSSFISSCLPGPSSARFVYFVLSQDRLERLLAPLAHIVTVLVLHPVVAAWYLSPRGAREIPCSPNALLHTHDDTCGGLHCKGSCEAGRGWMVRALARRVLLLARRVFKPPGACQHVCYAGVPGIVILLACARYVVTRAPA